MEIQYYINDHLGTPQQLVNQNQEVTWAADYQAFGEASIEAEVITNNHRFPGQYYDQESGLHYNWNRYYEPNTGRYITSDPIGLNGGMNTFGYVGGNPLYWYDRTGLAAQACLIPAVGAVCVTAAQAIVDGIVVIGGASAIIDGMSGVRIGPFPGATTNPNPEDAGDEAADEITDEDGQCPANGCSADTIRRCRAKCLAKGSAGSGGNFSEWIGRCVNRCTSALGCSNIGGF